MIRIAGNQWKLPPMTMTIVDDPVQCAEHARIREIFDRNFSWYQAHQGEVAGIEIGQCVCIAGQKVLVAPSAREVLDLARKAHPEEEGGYYFFYVRPERPRSTRGIIHADFGALD